MEYTTPCVTIVDLNECFRSAGTMSSGSDAASCYTEVGENM